VLSHNTIRGAAGATILNAELLASLGKFDPVAASEKSASPQREKTGEVGDAIAGAVSHFVAGY
jgi:hypothetical protein